MYLWQNPLGPWLNPKGISENVKADGDKIEDQSFILDTWVGNFIVGHVMDADIDNATQPIINKPKHPKKGEYNIVLQISLLSTATLLFNSSVHQHHI